MRRLLRLPPTAAFPFAAAVAEDAVAVAEDAVAFKGSFPVAAAAATPSAVSAGFGATPILLRLRICSRYLTIANKNTVRNSPIDIPAIIPGLLAFALAFPEELAKRGTFGEALAEIAATTALRAGPIVGEEENDC